MEMDYIIVENANKTIKGKKILNDINLKLEKGLVHGFFGRNASGKTMLFRAIAGLITLDSGSVNVFGKRITDDNSFPDSMGIMIENIGLWKNLTGMEALKLIADIKGIAGVNEIKDALTRVGLDPDDKRKYKAYSMGMRQKLVLAQAIMEKPELLILDEPTNGFDEQAVLLFRDIIRQEKERGATCLIATHQKDDVKTLCDKVYNIKDGYCSEVTKEEW